ncbi:MBL fold metallo-hydrolase [Clavibacter michiganensis]|uniref:MBL fold metallo-hydrolase n=1 Tax=Clavibacter michiganensis TaxID=28447 RepID=UPI002F41C98B
MAWHGTPPTNRCSIGATTRTDTPSERNISMSRNKGDAYTITAVEADVFVVRGSHVNWSILTEGSGMTLIDAGYPGNSAAVLDSLEEVSAKTGAHRLEAIVITHGHSDHIGGLTAVLDALPNTPRVLCSLLEASHVRREHLQQVTLRQVLRHAGQPGVLTWLLAAIQQGGLKEVGYSDVQAFAGDASLDIPGRPSPVDAPGHTEGHTAYYLERAGVLVTGDALITAHATSRDVGPQLLHPMFHGDVQATRETYDRLVNWPYAVRFAPGHGPVVSSR